MRKADKLCQLAEAEVYMTIRLDGRFYVYNSVDPASQVALKPEVCLLSSSNAAAYIFQADEKIVNVTMIGSGLVLPTQSAIGNNKE